MSKSVIDILSNRSCYGCSLVLNNAHYNISHLSCLLCHCLQGFKRETRFTSKSSAKDIISKIEEAAKPLGFDVQKKNYKVLLSLIRLVSALCFVLSHLSAR